MTKQLAGALCWNTPPPAPPGFSTESCFGGVRWVQRWEVFREVFTPGTNPVDRICEFAQLPTDLSGKRVLDIGAWNGCFSFECERRGAKEVVAYGLEDPNETGFNRLREVLNSKVQYIQNSAYVLSPQQLGVFDIILLFGVLYHLRYPLLAVDRIRSVSCGEVFIETHVIDNQLLVRPPFKFFSKFRLLPWLLNTTPLWRQYREYELHPEDQSNWFGPNRIAVIEAFESAGFECVHLKSWANRGAFRARACDALPSRLMEHSYESCASNKELVGLAQPC